ncbi:MAG TPA: SIMPL domain-containing protein [Gemmatimonadaceae bacterium]
MGAADLTSGRGEVRIKPAKAVVFFIVQTRGETGAEAAAEGARVVASVMKSLSAAGLKADDVSNNSYSVGPEFEYQREGVRKQVGFLATNGIRAEVTPIEKVGSIIDAGLNGGATQVSSTQFLGEKMDDSKRQAMKAAVEAARSEAETMAIAAGGQLGKLLSLSSGGVVMGGVAMARAVELNSVIAAGGAAAGTSIRPDELTVTANVSGRWEFIPNK